MSDVTGDGVPELLFVEKSPYSEEYVANLYPGIPVISAVLVAAGAAAASSSVIATGRIVA